MSDTQKAPYDRTDEWESRQDAKRQQSAPAMTEDERIVREAWERVVVEYGQIKIYDDPDCDTPSPFESWHAAAEFTRDRFEQIRQVKEEIEQMEDLCSYKLSDIECMIKVSDTPHSPFDSECLVIYVRDLCEYSRILAVRQAALIELRRGMKE